MSNFEHGVAYECGSNDNSVLEQIIQKFALNCEICHLDQQSQNIQDEVKEREVRLLSAKVTNLNPPKKSFVVICPQHFEWLEKNQDSFLKQSTISYQISAMDFKKTKLIKLRNISLLEAIQAIQNNYCCRILKLRYSNLEKQIQNLNCNDFEKTITSAQKLKERDLELTQKKFKFYVQNQDRMKLKQKFLIYHYYKQLLKKSQIQTPIPENVYVELAPMSISISIPISGFMDQISQQSSSNL